MSRKISFSFCIGILIMCCTVFATIIINNDAVGAVASSNVVKSISFASNDVYHELRVDFHQPITVDGLTNVHTDIENVASKIRINGRSVHELRQWNEAKRIESGGGGGVVQVHRYSFLMMYVILSDGKLPDSCDDYSVCTHKSELKEVISRDNKDTIEFLIGFSTGGSSPIVSTESFTLINGKWWRDGVVETVKDGWVNSTEGMPTGSGPAEFLDEASNPKHNFEAQAMTAGSAEYHKPIDAELGIFAQFAQLSTEYFEATVRNADGYGIKVKWDGKSDYVGYDITVSYLLPTEENIDTSISIVDGWHWYNPNYEWTTHSVKISRVDGLVVIKVNNIELPILGGMSAIHSIDISSINITVSANYASGGTLYLGKIIDGWQDTALNVASIAATKFEAPYAAQFQVNFVNNIGSPNQQNFISDTDYFVSNYIYINGNSVKSINQYSVNQSSGKSVLVHRVNSVLYFYLSDNLVNPLTNTLLVDSSRSLQLNIKEGFAANNNCVVLQEIAYYYNREHNDWYPQKNFLDCDVNFVRGVYSTVIGYATQIELNVLATNANRLSISNTLGVLDNIVVNGKTIREIKALDVTGDGSITSVEAHWMTTTLHLYIKSTIAGVGLDPAKTNSIVIKDNLVTPNGNIISRNQTFEYKPSYGNSSYWVERMDKTGTVLDEINVTKITGPHQDLTSGNVLFYIDFDAPIADKSSVFLQGEPWWLQAAGINTATEIRLNNLSGIYEKFRDCLMFNGKSYMEMFNAETNLGFQQIAISIHFGDGGLNRMVLSVMGSYDSKPLNPDKSNKSVNMIEDIDQPFVIELKAGFCSILGGELKSDAKYTYNPQFKSWTKTGEATGLVSAKINEVYYNGKKLDASTIINLDSDEQFDTKLLYVVLQDNNATYTVQYNQVLSKGNNLITIKSTAIDGIATDTFTFNIVKNSVKSDGCASIAGLSTNYIWIILIGASLAALIVFLRKRGTMDI